MSNLISSQYLQDEGFKNYYGILPDSLLMLLDMQLPVDKKMITPFFGNQIRTKSKIDSFSNKENVQKIISYGLTSYGYDIRASRDFKVYTNVNSTINDPKNVNEKSFVDFKNVDSILIPPNSYALCRSLEEFNLPRDITGIAMGKSTYARTGIVANITPLEAGWKGFLTIEVANCSSLPARIYAEEGICQIVFHKGIPCTVSYMDRDGKYQGQPAEIILPRM